MTIDIVIPFYKNEATLKNCILSIKDQDYKKYTITVVIDSEYNEKTQKIVNSLIDDIDCVIINEKNLGASKSRNKGAETGTGKILFFIDADCQLKPGVLRDVVTAFDLVPGIGFVYSNYQFQEDKSTFYSQEYDAHLLKTMNYICTMSPIRRDLFNEVGGFDDVPYFQDWGLFLKASMVMPGYYLGKNHLMFSTKKPTDKSISGKKGTLAQKSKWFRESYGLDHKPLVVTTWGAPLQAIQRAKMLDADYAGVSKSTHRAIFPTNLEFKTWKATYLMGCYNETLDALSNHLGVCVKKPIIHFIGTDVFHLRTRHNFETLQAIKQMFKSSKAKLLVNSSRCQQELKELGFKADLVFTPVENIYQYKAKELPKDFTVGVYYSDSNPMHKVDSQDGLSNVPLLMDVAKSLPMIKFKFFGGEEFVTPAKNIECVGRIPENEMCEFINSCSMVLRSTIHEGFPQLPIQFLLCGRQALVSCPDKELKYVERLSFEDNVQWEKNKSEVIDKLFKMMEQHVDPVTLSKNAFRYYGELLSVNTYQKEIYKKAGIKL